MCGRIITRSMAGLIIAWSSPPRPQQPLARPADGGNIGAMQPRPFRIYLRPKWTSIPIFTFGFMAVMFAFAIVTTHDSSRTAFVYPMAIFCLLTYLSFRAGLAWIRIIGNGEEIVSVPCWYSRKLFGEKGKVGKIRPGSELVFCRRTVYGALDGYYVTLRMQDGSEQVFWNSINGISRRRRMRIAKEVEQRFGLHVRQVKQNATPGAFEETEWAATIEKRGWRNIGIAMAAGLIPFLGVPVRLLTGDEKVIAFMGAVLWVCGTGMYWLLYRLNRLPLNSKDQNFLLALLVWTMTYIPFYLIAVVGTRALILKQ